MHGALSLPGLVVTSHPALPSGANEEDVLLTQDNRLFDNGDVVYRVADTTVSETGLTDT